MLCESARASPRGPGRLRGRARVIDNRVVRPTGERMDGTRFAHRRGDPPGRCRSV